MALGRVLGLRLRVPLASLGQVRGLDSDGDDDGDGDGDDDGDDSDGDDNAWEMIFKMLWKQESEAQCQGPTPEWTTSRVPSQGELLICLEIDKQDKRLNKKHRNVFHQSEKQLLEVNFWMTDLVFTSPEEKHWNPLKNANFQVLDNGQEPSEEVKQDKLPTYQTSLSRWLF